MDIKRLMLAVALSIVIIMLYTYFFAPQPQVPPPAPKGSESTAPQTPGTVESGTPDANSETQASDASTQPKATDYSGIYDKEEKKPAELKSEAAAEAVQADLKAEEEHDVTVETALYKAVLLNKGAGLKSFILKNYNDDLGQPLELINKDVQDIKMYPLYFSPWIKDKDIRDLAKLLNDASFQYNGLREINLNGSESRELVFTFADKEKNLRAVKTITLLNNSYVVGLKFDIVKDGIAVTDNPIIFGPNLENNTGKKRVMQSELELGHLKGDTYDSKEFKSFETTPIKGNADLEMGQGDLGANFAWASYQTNYFAAIFKTHSNVRYVVFKENIKVPVTVDESKDAATDNNSETGAKAAAPEMKDVVRLASYIVIDTPESFYFGPKDEQILGKLESQFNFRDANKVVAYGWSFIGLIAKWMQKAIVWTTGFIPNVGWALVFFTIIIKLLLFPLTYASSVSMAKMQTLQPKIKAIKKKYKNLKDPEQRKQMNVETMALYKTEKVNPAGGCLPMLLQMPILFAFFRLLPISINFRHEPWLLWITDLSIKDPYYILPILMGVTQIIVSKMSPSTGEGAQQKMMYMMPVVMIFLFMNYSAGLNLYWFISNLLQVVQQYFINKKIFAEKKEEDSMRKVLKRKKGGKLT